MFPGFNVIFGSPYGLAASPCAGAGSHITVAFPIRFRGSPMRFCGLPHISPAISPYGRYADTFPHTFWQIPIGRPFSHSHGRSPIARPSPHTIHKLQKSDFKFGETSGSCPQIPNQPVKQTSRTCVTIQQTNPQPVPANNMRHGNPANQSANQFQQMLQTCEGGCRHLLHVRPWSCMRAWSLTCTAMVIPSRACARPRQRHRATLLTRPAYGFTNQAPTQFTQMPCGCVTPPRIYASNRPTQNAWGAWASTTTLRRRRRRQGGSTCVIVRPEGR